VVGDPICTGGGTTELNHAQLATALRADYDAAAAAERAVAASVDAATGGGPLVVEMVVLTAS
jgi:hypothetical protein